MPLKKVATVPPADVGSSVWLESVKAFRTIGEKRHPEDPDAWAENYVRHDYDKMELRALGRCLECGQHVILRQYKGVVVSDPCGHYRAHGNLSKIVRFLEERRRKLTPERRASLLQLVGEP